MTTRSTLAAFLLLTTAACGDSSDAVGPTNAAGPQDVNASVTAAGQEDDILDLIDAQAAAWADHDGVAYGATYTEDAELINPVGGILVGRTVIANQHVFLFNPVNGPFRASASSWTVRSIGFLTGATALVKLDVALTGYSFLPPGLNPTEPGVVRTRVTWLAVKTGDTWLIQHQQMTLVAPTP